MSCVPDAPTFRLLDALVGWDPYDKQGLSGLDDLAGTTLTPLTQHLNATTISIALPPARLTRGCSPCEWFLVTCCPPESRLLRLNPCAPGWRSVWRGRCNPHVLRCATAIAVHCDRIAVSDPGAGQIWFWRRSGAELAFSIPMAQPGPIAWASWGEWLIADLATLRLRRFDASGVERTGALPLPGTAERIGVDRNCLIWLVTRDQDVHRVWMAERHATWFAPAAVKDLLQSFPDTGLRRVTDHYFCLEEEIEDGRHQRCFDCYGRPGTPPPAPLPQPRYEKQGQLLTVAIDSGTPRCRWHRVRIDADVPAGTGVALAVSTNEEDKPASQGVASADEWRNFPAGLPHPEDWYEGPYGALDFVIDQPPGRYLFVRLRLTGDGFGTPVVRRVRLDFPRQTSFARLPAVYHDNPAADDFGERFLALFDAAIEDIDRAIERHPALLDVDGAPDELLTWLGGFLDVAMDPGWSAEQRREILKAMPELYLKRGTAAGLSRALELVLGTKPAIEDTALSRMWGAVGESRLDGVRLFGRSTARVRVGRSALSGAPLWSVGNPDLDPLNAQAFRFRVMLPALANAALRDQAARVVESQKPAHTVASLHQGGAGIVIGQGFGVGIDTALVPLPPPVLGGGSGGVRLGRASVLWSAHRCADIPTQVGQASAAGIHTLMG
jgi:phage tail-like protein